MPIKKIPLIAGILALFLLLASACSNGSTNGTSKSNQIKKDKVVIDILQGKLEIADQLKALTDLYTKEHPNVTFNIETVGFGADMLGGLKAEFASGKPPDMFTSEGYQAAITWKDELEDLSDQPWVKDSYPGALKPMTIDGKVYGQPVNLEGYGFIYNKALFKRAGITELPKTFTELKTAAEKLRAAGITPFSVGYAEWWVLANHGLNVPFAYAQTESENFIPGLNSGKAKMEGNKYFDDYFKLLDLTIKYGNKNPLTTDYNTEVTQFAKGETAMIQQGNWIQPLLDKLTPNMDVGFIPMPLTDDPSQSDRLMVDVPSSWVIYKKAPEADKKAAKEFLNWMVSSSEGTTALTKDFKYIPAFKNIEAKAEDIGPLGNDILQYMKAGKTYSWQFMKYPDGASKDFATALQSYISGQITKEETEKSLDATWAKLKK
ncbi:carbohydrate ABC transporter substrate-binding protein [Bacillus sp. BRMEA1]|uniref:ABC transporter substrate-binding protein n=1 Tax=Neobacillus endophyticus TaxID=2738405 RepID=UPI00156371BE|nr:ABC transporter substrate-binding protein [Neobacillus endophyticus]NRD77922.1 carbohydrate ABC transporter substrate-binding protein [Neobacillus endophyticus]